MEKQHQKNKLKQQKNCPKLKHILHINSVIQATTIFLLIVFKVCITSFFQSSSHQSQIAFTQCFSSHQIQEPHNLPCLPFVRFQSWNCLHFLPCSVQNCISYCSSDVPFSFRNLCLDAFSEMLAFSPGYPEHFKTQLLLWLSYQKDYPWSIHQIALFSCFLLYALIALIFVTAVNTMGYSLSAYLSFLPWSVNYFNLETMYYPYSLLAIQWVIWHSAL